MRLFKPRMRDNTARDVVTDPDLTESGCPLESQASRRARNRPARSTPHLRQRQHIAASTAEARTARLRPNFRVGRRTHHPRPAPTLLEVPRPGARSRSTHASWRFSRPSPVLRSRPGASSTLWAAQRRDFGCDEPRPQKSETCSLLLPVDLCKRFASGLTYAFAIMPHALKIAHVLRTADVLGRTLYAVF